MTTSRPAAGPPCCRDLVSFLQAYLERELPPAEQAEFERHLAICPPCRAYLDTYRQTIDLERGAYRVADELPAPLPEELVQAILAARPGAR